MRTFKLYGLTTLIAVVLVVAGSAGSGFAQAPPARNAPPVGNEHVEAMVQVCTRNMEQMRSRMEEMGSMEGMGSMMGQMGSMEGMSSMMNRMEN